MPDSDVALVDVSEPVLEQMIEAACTDATPDEVTPPLGDEPGWSPAHVQWIRDLHRACRAGLSGPARQATWAIVLDGRVVGAIRLKQLDEPRTVETGIWLARSARGHGVSTRALELLIAKARELDASVLRADTTRPNLAAQAALKRLGFVLSERGDGHTIDAELRLSGRTGG